MNDEAIQPRPYLKLLLLAALLGLISAIVTFIFVVLVQVGQTLLWEQAASTIGLSMSLLTVLICALGGLLVGILVKVFGDHSGIFAEIWKGGYIFPTMFAGVALGMAAHLIFPSIPMAVAVAATMGGAMVATMKAPIFSALFVSLLVQKEAGPVIAIAVIVGLLVTARLSMTPARSEGR